MLGPVVGPRHGLWRLGRRLRCHSADFCGESLALDIASGDTDGVCVTAQRMLRPGRGYPYKCKPSPANPRHIPGCKNACRSAKSAAVSCEETVAASGAQSSVAGWYSVRPPDCMVPGRGLALCLPAGWHGVQPPVCAVFGHRKNGDFAICERTLPKAAFVCPPWFASTLRVIKRMSICELGLFHTAGSRQPFLVHSDHSPVK